MSQNAVSQSIAARIGPRRRKTEKEGKYHEFRSFRTVREYLDWWTRDEGRNWKVNSRQSHPRGSVEYWRCKFQLDGCYICPARLRIVIGFDDSVVVYRSAGFSHQHERTTKKQSEVVSQAITLELFEENIGRSFFLDAPPLEPEEEQEHELQILLLNAREVLIRVRELTGTVEGLLLNTPEMLLTQTIVNRATPGENDDDEEVPFDNSASEEVLQMTANRSVQTTNTSRSLTEATQIQTQQVIPLETNQTVQSPKQISEGVKEVQKEVKEEVQKSNEVIQKEKEIETKKPTIVNVCSSAVQITTEDSVKTKSKQLKPPKFATEGGICSSVPKPTLPQINSKYIVNDDPKTQSDENVKKSVVKLKVETSNVKTKRLITLKSPKFATEGGVMGGSSNAKATTSTTTTKEANRTNNNNNNEENNGGGNNVSSSSSNASGNSTN